MANWKQHSRTCWEDVGDTSKAPSDERIKLGAIQRLADSAEQIVVTLGGICQELRLQRKNGEKMERMRRRIRKLEGKP